MQRRLQRRWVLAAALAVVLSMSMIPTAGAWSSSIYWWQRNMAPNAPAVDRNAHNHTYNELYFGPNAGWQSQVWEVTPAGYRHFDKRCVGNCFNAHPGYYYTYSYCANRDGRVHFVYNCMDEW